MDTVIHVCYALNDISGKYAKFIGASLCSVLENTKNPVIAHILHDDTLTDDNKNRLVDLVNRYKQKVCFYNILVNPSFSDFISKIQQIYLPQYQGMLYRFAVGAFLPSNLDRVIYLDADTIIHMDIAKLWNVDLGNASVAAVSDSIIAISPTNLVPSVIKNGVVQQDKYFNSGVILMDMKYFRVNRYITDDVLEFLVKDGINTKYPDQDFLNCVFSESCLLLPVEYNLLVSYARLMNVDQNEAILHYAGGALRMDIQDTYDKLFWYYFFRTPWHNETAFMQSLSDLIKSCRELAERSNLLTLLLRKPRKLIFGSRVLASKVETFLCGTFYDSGEDETTNLTCGEIFDVFFSLPPSERMIVILSNHYEILKELFVNMGLEEDSDFVNGYVLTLPEKKAVDFNDSVIIGKY